MQNQGTIDEISSLGLFNPSLICLFRRIRLGDLNYFTRCDIINHGTLHKNKGTYNYEKVYTH